jgi:acylphosphatase
VNEEIRHLSIRGRVQGVGFRMFVEQVASTYGLAGWVRNRRDGSVEAVFAGAQAALDQAIDQCQRGPRGARVEAVDIDRAPGQLLSQRYAGERFSVLPTA